MDRKELIPRGLLRGSLILALFLAVFISPFASRLPDGLKRVAQEKGFSGKPALRPSVPVPLSDYIWPGIKNEKLAKAFAGLAGTLAVFMLGYVVALILRKARN
jgi:cobalt/nickel transport protein